MNVLISGSGITISQSDAQGVHFLGMFDHFIDISSYGFVNHDVFFIFRLDSLKSLI